MKSEAMKDMIVGIIFFFIIGELIICIINYQLMVYMVGYAIGAVLAVVMTINMAWCIDKSLNREEQQALKFTRVSYIIRYLVMAIVIVVVAFINSDCLITVLFGLLTLKLSAYLQPITNKVRKYLSKGR